MIEGQWHGFTCGLALQQDFDGFLSKLKEYPDIGCLGGVIGHSWGRRVIRFYDLDGHIIEAGEDMKMDASVEGLAKPLNA